MDDEAEDEGVPPPPDQDEGESVEPPRPRGRRSSRRVNLPSYSLLNYYQWNTAYRPETDDTFSAQHYGGKLFQQYCVDAFSKVEENRLDQLRTTEMQKKIRAHTYSGLKKHLEARAQRAGEHVLPGKPIVLP